MNTKKITLLLTLLLCSSLLHASPAIQHWQTENGASVYFVPAPELPMVDIQLVFDAGAARDGEQGGLAAMTSAMMDEGAAGLNADQIAEATDSVGAAIGFSAHQDMAVASLRSVTDATLFEPAIALFQDILTQPDFPQEALTRIRKQMLIGLQAKKQQPGAIARDTFMQALYGDHPYGKPSSGNEASLNALTRADLIAYYQRYYVASNATLAIVGDLDRAAAEKLANRLISQLATGDAAPKLPAVSVLKQAHEQRISHPSSQSHLMLGQPGLKRGDKDYFSLYVGNHILGGSGLTSRISNEIREKRGLSYSAYSYFSPMRELGPYILALQTKNASVDEALQVMRETLIEFRDNGPTASELDASKKNITGGFPLRLDSNKKIVGYLAMIGFYQLPLDYLDTFNDNINAVTLEQIKEAYQRRINPDKLVTIIVGGDG
ncbi:FIG015287: Zinc protease [hydrothermal vent metagenome]|uniref:FIG015287: Zinc protease n=1 Tax=hydrothermal vent metagenome TaxID=652676 RepID=A0A3B0ZR87_9ZZZZ